MEKPLNLYSSRNPGDGKSVNHSISGGGVPVAFYGKSTKLIAPLAEGNGRSDIFVHKRNKGTKIPVGVDVGGGGSEAWSRRIAISHDDNSAAVEGDAVLDPLLDTNGQADVYVQHIPRSTTVGAAYGAPIRPDLSPT